MSGDMEDGLREYERRCMAAANRGVAKAAMRLLDDSINETPGVPIDEGTLRGSGSAHVDGQLEQVAPVVGGTPTPMTDPIPEDKVFGSIVASVGFNTPYAAVMHEGEWKSGPLAGVKIQNYNDPGTGEKFLERPMSENRDTYLGIVAKEIGGVSR